MIFLFFTIGNINFLTQPTGSGVHKKKVVVLSPEESLVRPEDLEDLGESSDKPPVAEHVRYITEIAEKTREIRESFKPYKTTKSNVHDPGKEIGRKRDKHWEITAATPPPSIHGTVKSLSIEESLLLQKEQAEKLRVGVFLSCFKIKGNVFFSFPFLTK